MTIRCLSLTVATLLLLASHVTAQDPPVPLPQPQPKDEARKEALNQIIQKAQEEYRLYFKEPKTALEYWAAASFEIQVGKWDIAAYHLDKLLQQPDKERDDDLLKIEEAEGLNTFLRLRTVKEWSKNSELNAEARKTVETLIDRVIAALEKHLGNRERLNRFVEGLSDKIPEVRAFSLFQLDRAKHRAAPALAEALRDGPPENRANIKNAIVALSPDIVPPLLELFSARDAKDAADVQFRLDLLWLAKARQDKRVIPYLWHLTSAPYYPKIVRDEAKVTLAYLLGTTADRLPDAKIALTKLAEDYYQHKVRYPDVTEVADRMDPTKQIPVPAYKKWYRNEAGNLNDTPDTLRPDDARFEFGLRFARQAMDLDPAYVPAQAVYLALLLEAEATRNPRDGQLDKMLTEKSSPALRQLLAKIDSELLKMALERAMEEQNYAVMLPLIDAAGDRGDTRLAQPAAGGTAGLLVRLLYYPDSRVQYAAARALLKMPATKSPIASSRIVEVLQRFLATDFSPKVLILFSKDDEAGQLRQAAKDAGYDAVLARTLNDAMRLLHATADFDAIILNDNVYPSPSELPFALTQLRNDHSAGNLPLLLVANPHRGPEMYVITLTRKNTFVLPEAWAFKGSELKRQIEDAIKFSAAPIPLRKAPQEQQQWLQYEVRRAKGQNLSEAERKMLARDSLDWFAQMARGELPGYDLNPAKNALIDAINNDDMALQAVRVLARIPAAEIQQRLAYIILDAKKVNLHIPAAQELSRHIQKNGLGLNADQITLLQQLEQTADVPAPLRVELAAVIGAVRTTPRMTGVNLLNYTPDTAPKK